MSSTELPPWIQTILALALAAGGIIAGMIGGRKSAKPDEPKGEASIVTATFMDRQSIRDLTSTTANLHSTLLRLVDLLETEAHRKEVEAEVRQALKERGITL